MNEKLEKIKQHVVAHKEMYIAATVGLAVGVVITVASYDKIVGYLLHNSYSKRSYLQSLRYLDQEVRRQGFDLALVKKGTESVVAVVDHDHLFYGD